MKTKGRRRLEKRRGGPGASSAFGWSLLNTIVARFATLGIGIVLARVLGPEEFGTFAVALVVLMAILSFNELGVSLAIVRWPQDPKHIAPTVNTISVVASIIIFCGAYVLTPAVATAMGDPEATKVIQLLLVSVLINGAVATPAALLQRRFQERTRMVIDQTNVWVGAIISLVLALMGFGAMSLAIGRLAGSLISGVMFLAASPLPYRFGWNREVAPQLLRFGLPLAGSSIVVFAVGYADQLTVGAALGATALGFYVLAFNLSSWPMSIVSQPLRRVAPAAFSHLQANPAGLGRTMSTLMGLLAVCTVPLFAFVSGASRSLVEFIYGSQWLPSAAVLSFLVFSALVRLAYELMYDYLVVLGRTGTVFAVQLVSLCIMVPALLLGGYLRGLVGLSAAHALVSWLVILPMYGFQLSRAGVKISAIVRRALSPVLIGLGVGIASYYITLFIPSTFWGLAAGGTLAFICTATMLYVRRADLAVVRGIGQAKTEAEPVGDATTVSVAKEELQ
ncbi:lipopolysaccharide biosynthesis protein [Glutamicibacter soli]|uniref:lipopolysaccharide biosynthesis protein n=1 Tax=Glutamicibacter soli TaxID=453836 RepID=UPI003C712F66